YGTTNNVGRIRSRTDYTQGDQSASYAYDGVYRLTDVTNSTWAIHWQFDAYGNRTVQNPTGDAMSRVGSQTLSGHVNNRLPISCPGLPGTSCYDAAGHLLNDASATPHNFTYDAEGRMTQMSGGDIGTIQFAYDGEGQRIK